MIGENTVLQEIATFYERLDLTVGWAMLASWVTLIVGILIVSYVTNLIGKRYLLALFDHWVEKKGSRLGRGIMKHKVFLRLSHIIPALIIYLFVPWIIVDGRPFTVTLEVVIQVAAKIYIVIIMAMVFSAFGNLIEEYYRQASIIKHRPIKSYIEVAKILVYIVAAILIGSIILNKSPVVLLTGLGAATAVISLVFKDSVLGFVASIQIGTYDLVRIGDWIEVPAYGADGEVTDISLNTIKVQNWDKTIVTIPTYALTNTQMKNWRGMLDAGGRRIKRAINIDMHSVRFCDAELLNRLKQVEHIKEYLIKKHEEIEQHNRELQVRTTECPVNGRSLTNIGIFRAYLEYYLRSNPDLHQEMIFFVRQLAPSAEGLPIEIYVFTRLITIGEYESIQADLFDHILAILPYFELRVFQNATD